MTVSAAINGNIDAVQFSHLLGTDILTATSTSLALSGGGVRLTLVGTGFTYDGNEQLSGGTVTSIDFADPEPSSASGRVLGHISGLSLPVGALVGWLAQNANASAFSTMLSGSDQIGGTTNGSDLLRGYDGNDTIQGFNGAADTIYGGAGDDSITASATSADLLIGGPGADTLAGGGGAFADIFEVGAGESPAALAAGGLLSRLDHIIDWSNSDVLVFTAGAASTPSTYAEVTAGAFDQAAAIAKTNLAQGIEYTVAQVGADLIAFDLKVGDAVVVTNRTLADISQASVRGDPAAPPPPPPVSPGTGGATVSLSLGFDMGSFQEHELDGSTGKALNSTDYWLTWGEGGRYALYVGGVGLTYGGANGALLTGGIATTVHLIAPEGAAIISGAHADGAMLGQAYTDNNSLISFASLLAGDDQIRVIDDPTSPDTSYDHTYLAYGFAGNDVMMGGGGADTLSGDAGDDSLDGGAGDDSLNGGGDVNTLFGGDGDDVIQGGADFDRTNGNAGADTVQGADGDDWVTGGKDDDNLSGDAGKDILNGNLGADTGDGGAGADTVRGGQGDDVLSGGTGDDYMTGDLGNDTLTGGTGADTFRAFAGGGHDVIADFNAAEGDRLVLDAGTTHTASQVGSDTVIDLGNGSEMTLKGIQLSNLPSGWVLTL